MSVDSLVQFLLQAILYWGGYNHWTGTTGLNYWTHLNCKIQLVRRISAEQKLNFRIPQLLR